MATLALKASEFRCSSVENRVSPTHIKYELDSVCGNSAPLFTKVKFWTAEFIRGHESLGNDECSGRPGTETTDKHIAKDSQLVLDDRQIKLRKIEEVINIKKMGMSHIKTTFRHEKAARALGAAFAHVKPKSSSGLQ